MTGVTENEDGTADAYLALEMTTEDVLELKKDLEMEGNAEQRFGTAKHASFYEHCNESFDFGFGQLTPMTSSSIDPNQVQHFELFGTTR